MLMVARVLQGCSSAVVWTVGMAVLAETLPPERLGVAMGTVGSVVSLGMVSSPVLGGTICIWISSCVLGFRWNVGCRCLFAINDDRAQGCGKMGRRRR
jgi:MFS family permease